MTAVSPPALLEQLRWRYAVKRFDSSRKLASDVWQALESSLILTPSSYGLQPWRFIVISDEAVKSKLPSISWNQKQPQECSHMVVLAARRTVSTEYVDRYIDSVTEVRGLPTGAMSGYRNVLVSTVTKTEGQHLDWNARQVYIALGQLMVSAAMLGVDSCPMEGIDTAAYDQLLGLSQTEYTSIVGCALGYRHPQDAQAQAAKVRFDAREMIEHR